MTDKQREYLMGCSRRWNVKTGATGSGKTFVDVVATIPKRIEACRGEGLIVLLGNTQATLERNILEPMRAVWPGRVGHVSANNTIMIFGRRCYALGANNRGSVSRIQGATFEYVYGDEVTTWSAEVFQMLKSRLRCEHSRFDGTCNPDSPGHWFKRFIDSDVDIYCQSYTIDDGCLPEHVVENLKREYAGTVYFDRYILGKWTQAEGLVYQNHEKALEDRYDGEVVEQVISIDYGTRNPFAALKWSLDPGGVWHCVDEWTYSGRETGHDMTDEDYLDALMSFVEDIPDDEVTCIIDPSASSFIALLRRSGRFRVRRARNDVLTGIRETASCIQSGRVKVSLDCKRTVDEFGSYVWDDRSESDRVVKENDHCMDAMRYMVATLRLAKNDIAYESPFGLE